ncbi:MAG: hypothetical protein GX779_06380 [Clostridia bacterium]|jgi:uncharacterized membrane protein YcjF (UPF0283 family)|nr:hypothetical protein [Clostridia bacterium]
MGDLTPVFFLASLAVVAFIVEEILTKMEKKEWARMVNLGLGIIGLLLLLDMLENMIGMVRKFTNW